MKRYTKEINGKSVIKNRNEIVINLKELITDESTGELIEEVDITIINPSEDVLLENGWVEYVTLTPELTPEELLSAAKEDKLKQLKEYDESEEVNDCIIKYQYEEFHYWANKSERDALKGAVRDFISLDRETYRLDIRDLGISLNLPCNVLLGMLTRLEAYAADCYNKTTDHEYSIKKLKTIEEVDLYNFRTGYPKKLTFTI